MDSQPFDWSNPDPDPSDLDPVNPPRGAGLTGSNGSKCDLCAYMAGKTRFCTHCGTHTWIEIELADFLYNWRGEYDFLLLRPHGNSQGSKKCPVDSEQEYMKTRVCSSHGLLAVTAKFRDYIILVM